MNKPNNKRPRGRNSGGGGRRPQHSGNRSYDSNGPEVKVRGTATQICDKYLALARDASSSGDRVRAESLLQHAEHYFRLVNGGDDARNNPGQDGRRNHAPAGVTVSGEMVPDEIVAQPQPQQQPQMPQQEQPRPTRRQRAEMAATTDSGAEPKTILTEGAAAIDQEATGQSAEAVVIEEAAIVAQDAPEVQNEATDEAEVIVEPVVEMVDDDEAGDDPEQTSEVA